MFSSARRPGNFQVDVDPVDNFGSSSTGVRARRPGNFQVDVDPVDNFGSSSTGVRARRPGNFQVDVDPVDNFGSSSTCVRARPPLPEFSTGCSQAPPPGIRESMLSQGTTPGCLRPGCWGARPPVVFECTAGLSVISGSAAGARLRTEPRPKGAEQLMAFFSILLDNG